MLVVAENRNKLHCRLANLPNPWVTKLKLGKSKNIFGLWSFENLAPSMRSVHLILGDVLEHCHLTTVQQVPINQVLLNNVT